MSLWSQRVRLSSDPCVKTLKRIVVGLSTAADAVGRGPSRRCQPYLNPSPHVALRRFLLDPSTTEC